MLGAVGDELEQRDRAILELANALEVNCSLRSIEWNSKAQKEAQKTAEVSPGQERRSIRRKSRKDSES